MVPNLFGNRDGLSGRQFFQGSRAAGVGEGRSSGPLMDSIVNSKERPVCWGGGGLDVQLGARRPVCSSRTFQASLCPPLGVKGPQFLPLVSGRQTGTSHFHLPSVILFMHLQQSGDNW